MSEFPAVLKHVGFIFKIFSYLGQLVSIVFILHILRSDIGEYSGFLTEFSAILTSPRISVTTGKPLNLKEHV